MQQLFAVALLWLIFRYLLLVGDVLVVGHDEVVGALHETGELALAVGTEQVVTCLGDEDVVLAVGPGLLDEEQFIARLDDDGMAVFHPE